MNLKDLIIGALLTLVIVVAWSMHIVYNDLTETQERYRTYLENNITEAIQSVGVPSKTGTIAYPKAQMN